MHSPFLLYIYPLQKVLNGTRFLDKKMPYQPAPQMLIDNAQ